MKIEDRQALLLVIQNIECKYTRMETLRRLAGTEENYRLIIREVDRVKSQLSRARAIGAAATLTIMEWFAILDRFDWKCAYCQKQSFQVLSHKIAQAQGGTTAENCLPACYRCLNRHRARVTLFQSKKTLSLPEHQAEAGESIER